MHQNKECLLERVLDFSGSRQYPVEALLDELRDFQRIEDRLCDANSYPAQPPFCLRVGQQIVRQQCVQIQDRRVIKTDVTGMADQKFDGLFVVEDHLRI